MMMLIWKIFFILNKWRLFQISILSRCTNYNCFTESNKELTKYYYLIRICGDKRNFHPPLHSHLCMKGVKINEAYSSIPVKKAWKFCCTIRGTYKSTYPFQTVKQRASHGLTVDEALEMANFIKEKNLFFQMVLDGITGCTWLAIKHWKSLVVSRLCWVVGGLLAACGLLSIFSECRCVLPS